MREAGRRLAEVVAVIAAKAEEGVFLKTLDTLTHALIMEKGDEPAFLGYRPEGAKRPYPASICASVNETIVHGIPSAYRLKEGDLVKLDFGLRHKGYCADMAVTVAVGSVGAEAKRLIETTRRALLAGIRAAVPGGRLGDIGFAIEKVVRDAKFHVAHGLTGHGIGTKLHEDPVVYNYGTPGRGLILKEGMALALEPMVAVGTGEVTQLDDDSFVTADGSLSAHFEHTILIGPHGPEILTVV